MGDPAKHHVETVWINEFFRHYGGSVRFCEQDLRNWNFNLLEVLEAGRSGYVIDGDKRESNGAWWTIEGQIDEADWVHVTVVVVTEIHFVEIVLVERVERNRDNGQHDAA